MRLAKTLSIQVGSAALAVIAIGCAVKLLGFAEKQLIAYYFGAGSYVDAWFVAVSVPTMLFLFVREVLEPAFLPVFMGYLDSGRPDRGWHLFTCIGAGIIVLSLSVAMVAYLNADTVAQWLAPGFSAAAVEQTGELIRVTIFGGAILAISTLTYITLNGYKRFAAPASGDLALKAVSVACIVLLVSDLGLLAFAVGLVAGSAGRLLVHLLALKRELRWLSWPRRYNIEDLREFSGLMAPLLIGVLFAQIADLADNFFSSLAGAGGVAARTFAQKIIDLPVVLVPYALSVVAFPHFVTFVEQRKWDDLYRLLTRLLLGLALIFSGLSVAVFLLSEPIVTILLQRGAFSASATELTARVLRFYALGLVTFAFEAVLVPVYFAMRDTRTPVIVGILAVAVDIGLAASLVGSWGVASVAVALTVAKTTKVIILGVLLKRRRPGLRLGPVVRSALRLVAASLVAGVGTQILITAYPSPEVASGIYRQILYLSVMTTTVFVLFASVILSMNCTEREVLFKAFSLLQRFINKCTAVHKQPPAKSWWVRHKD